MRGFLISWLLGALHLAGEAQVLFRFGADVLGGLILGERFSVGGAVGPSPRSKGRGSKRGFE